MLSRATSVVDRTQYVALSIRWILRADEYSEVSIGRHRVFVTNSRLSRANSSWSWSRDCNPRYRVSLCTRRAMGYRQHPFIGTGSRSFGRAGKVDEIVPAPFRVWYPIGALVHALCDTYAHNECTSGRDFYFRGASYLVANAAVHGKMAAALFSSIINRARNVERTGSVDCCSPRELADNLSSRSRSSQWFSAIL